jgi:hypothetical protein
MKPNRASIVDGDMILVAHGGHGDVSCVLGTVSLDYYFGALHHPAHIGILLGCLCWLFWPYFASQLARFDGFLLLYHYYVGVVLIPVLHPLSERSWE